MEYSIKSAPIRTVIGETKIEANISGGSISTTIGEGARMNVSQATVNIESGKAEIEAGVTEVLNQVDDHVAEKTAEFDQNAQDKTDAFNLNASNKTGNFNDNYTNKLNAFNQNASDKTDAFDLNASNKTGDFNDNYVAKKALIDAEVGIAQAAATNASNSADLSKQWAIGEPTEPSEGSAKYWAEQAAASGGLPDQTGNEGKFLTTDGTDASWKYALNYIGTYSATTQYHPGDIVQNYVQGSYHKYLCKKDALGQYPDVTNDYWQDLTGYVSGLYQYSNDYPLISYSVDGWSGNTAKSVRLIVPQTSAAVSNIPTVNTYSGLLKAPGGIDGYYTSAQVDAADNNLQSQIDALVVASDVFDIVGTYAELQAYNITTVPVNDIIKVLVDSTHSNAATYYRCVEIGGVKSWSYIGSEGAYYTKGEADNKFVPQTRTVNSKALSSDITLTASDVGALQSGDNVSELVNDAGYTTNIGTVTSVNGNSPDASGAVTVSGLTVDQIYDATSANAQSGTAVAGAISALLGSLYPVGSLYIGTQASCPLASLITGSTWALVSAGKALWTGNGQEGSGTTTNANFANAKANTTIAAGAPNITFSLTNKSIRYDQQSARSGALTVSQASGTGVGTGSGGTIAKLDFSATNSNSIYGNSTTVQPPAYVVNVWRRTA